MRQPEYEDSASLSACARCSSSPCGTEYDARTGWRFAGYPFTWQISQVTKRQALAMIDERQIKTYGVRRGQILMSSNDGKWLSLNYSDNQDVVRQLGSQGVQYVGYYDDWE